MTWREVPLVVILVAFAALFILAFLTGDGEE